MSYISCGIQSRLQQAFSKNNISLNIRSDCIVAEESCVCTKEKIQEIIESVGLCPLISENKVDRNFVFTITPYKLPDFIGNSSLNLKTTEKDKGLYLTKHEVLNLLEQQAFVAADEVNPKDQWCRVNNFRSLVSTALSKGLCEVISRHVKDDHPIIEIGSGIGYTLSENLSSNTIRTQPNQAECQLLSKSISGPIYQADIQGINNCLLKSGKKIPLFFSINVFDTLSPTLRKASFSQISQLQNTDDRILIMLDTNPCLDVTVEYLESLYPEHAIFPFFPLTNGPSKLSVVIVPIEHVEQKPSQSQLLEMINEASMAMRSGQVSQIQYGLHQLQKKFNLKVIHLEDFFADSVKNELMQAGYQADVYYHTSFATGDLPEGISKIKQDLVYKPVTDTATVREWCLTDQKLLNSLSQKGLHLPNHFNEEFLFSLREKGQKIFGAEILVIDAKKI